MPVGKCPEIEVQEFESQRRGLEDEVANGETIANEGERRCMSMTAGAKAPKRIALQVAEVHKRCCPTARLPARGTSITSTVGGEGGVLVRRMPWESECPSCVAGVCVSCGGGSRRIGRQFLFGRGDLENPRTYEEARTYRRR